jgi:hypothetical protein
MAKEPTPEMVKKVFSMMGKRGGPARAKSLTRAERVAIAKRAAATRWAKTNQKKESGQ